MTAVKNSEREEKEMQRVNEKTPAPAVRKRPFWKRVNRGLVVSLVLLAAVIVYVVISQLMLIPDKNAIRALADRVGETYMSAITLSDEQLAALEDPEALNQKADAVAGALEPYFVTDSPYKTEEPIVTLRDNIQNQLLDVDRYEKQELQKTKYGFCRISDDVARLSVSYLYSVSGSRYDAGTETTVDVTDERQMLEISVICQKVDGEWKLYRVIGLTRQTNEWYIEEVFGK